MEFETKSLTLVEGRQSVITEMERAIFTHRYNFSEKHFIIFSKNSISILYSIWEGFVQEIFSIFIDEINHEGIKLFEMSDSIIIFCCEREFRQLKNYPLKVGKKISYLRKLKEFYSKETRIIPRNIDTESNVGFDVLNRLLSQFNLETYSEQWGNYKYPSPSLKDNLSMFLRLRNTIAHGGELLPEESINQENYKRYKNLCIDLMYDLRMKLLNGLLNKKYLITSNVNR
jgi:hypothetical protein